MKGKEEMMEKRELEIKEEKSLRGKFQDDVLENENERKGIGKEIHGKGKEREESVKMKKQEEMMKK